MRYRLRTLLILLALLPPLLAVGWVKYVAWKAEQEQREQINRLARQARLAAQAKTMAPPVDWTRKVPVDDVLGQVLLNKSKPATSPEPRPDAGGSR
jgi:hypothetical protein